MSTPNSSNQFNIWIALLWLCLGFYLSICISIGMILLSTTQEGNPGGIKTLVTISDHSSAFLTPLNSFLCAVISFVSVKEDMSQKKPKTTTAIIIFSIVLAAFFFGWSIHLGSEEQKIADSFEGLKVEQIQVVVQMLQGFCTPLISYPGILLGLNQQSKT